MLDELVSIFGQTIKLNDSLEVNSSKFAELFSDAEELTYDELMRVEEENNYGYKKYIEKWKEEGLIE